MTQKLPETFFNHLQDLKLTVYQRLFLLFGDFIQLRLTPYLLIVINDCLRHPIPAKLKLIVQ